jgi:hypothetical protein
VSDVWRVTWGNINHRKQRQLEIALGIVGIYLSESKSRSAFHSKRPITIRFAHSRAKSTCVGSLEQAFLLVRGPSRTTYTVAFGQPHRLGSLYDNTPR